MQRVVMEWSTVYANTQSPTKMFIPATGWIEASSVKYVRAVWEIISAMTNASVEFAYQTCNVENAPDTPAVPVGSAMTSASSPPVSFGTKTDVSGTTGSKNLVRLGFLVTNTAAATLVLARCGGYVEIDDC